MRVRVEWGELRARVFSGLVGASLAAFLFWMSGYALGSLVCRFGIRLLAWGATYELVRMTQIVYKDLIHPSFHLLLSIFFFVCVDFLPSLSLALLSAISLISVLIFFDPFSAFIRLSSSLLIFLYVHFPIALFEQLLEDKLPHGRWWVLYLLLVAKGSDTGAYFSGKHFGKQLIAPRVSPNKTVVGVVGGMVFATVLALFLCLFTTPPWSGSVLTFCAPGVALFAQFGDLIESSFKRSCGVRSSGSFSGMGGILDMLDSVLMVCPLIYALACL
ncbi:phosphatidate cytidylyltransferase [Candidatus Similichlamydia laticola]|uniref:Phosphatidate cytidylyltransferase n=1 Tax=Candidatus Similichlamydia laticola TaxID=2170265 RepID=A0A369KGC1_9BACT|nr:phosphatidate cytidylyltransferase [Candidatus Similichlamydia laticola]RDB31755.1 Phosphatidate cytidylyltransferase [Candidatus Similichlamydia laticola]